jgi:hypothetical protein
MRCLFRRKRFFIAKAQIGGSPPDGHSVLRPRPRSSVGDVVPLGLISKRYHGPTKSILSKLFLAIHLCVEMKNKREIDRRANARAPTEKLNFTKHLVGFWQDLEDNQHWKYRVLGNKFKSIMRRSGYQPASFDFQNLPPRKFTGPQPGCGSLSREVFSFV